MAEEDTTHVPAQLTHRLAHLNPFRSKGDEGGEEKGELVTGDSIAGGGRRAEDRSGLHVSHAIRAFLAEKGEIGESDIGGTENDAHLSEGVVKVLNRLPVNVPEYVMDRNHSLSEYYISSSVSVEQGIH
jgi:phosphatidylinositol phospholipase C, delta